MKYTNSHQCSANKSRNRVNKNASSHGLLTAKYHAICERMGSYPRNRYMYQLSQGMLCIHASSTSSWEELAGVFTLLGMKNTLKHLAVQGEDADSMKEGIIVSAVGSQLSLSRHLTSLTLSNVQMSATSVQTLTKSFHKNVGLQALTLSQCPLNAEDVEKMCSGLKNLASLTYLAFMQCCLDINSATYIAKLIEHQSNERNSAVWHNTLRHQPPDSQACPGLRFINLSNNPGIGNTGLRRLCQALEEDIWIYGLNLNHCGLSDSGAERLMRLLRHNRTLSIVAMEDNSLLGDDMRHRVEDLLRERSGGTSPNWNNITFVQMCTGVCMAQTKGSEQVRIPSTSLTIPLPGEKMPTGTPWRIQRRLWLKNTCRTGHQNSKAKSPRQTAYNVNQKQCSYRKYQKTRKMLSERTRELASLRRKVSEALARESYLLNKLGDYKKKLKLLQRKLKTGYLLDEERMNHVEACMGAMQELLGAEGHGLVGQSKYDLSSIRKLKKQDFVLRSKETIPICLTLNETTRTIKLERSKRQILINIDSGECTRVSKRKQPKSWRDEELSSLYEDRHILIFKDCVKQNDHFKSSNVTDQSSSMELSDRLEVNTVRKTNKAADKTEDASDTIIRGITEEEVKRGPTEEKVKIGPTDDVGHIEEGFKKGTIEEVPINRRLTDEGFKRGPTENSFERESTVEVTTIRRQTGISHIVDDKSKITSETLSLNKKLANVTQFSNIEQENQSSATEMPKILNLSTNTQVRDSEQFVSKDFPNFDKRQPNERVGSQTTFASCTSVQNMNEMGGSKKIEEKAELYDSLAFLRLSKFEDSMDDKLKKQSLNLKDDLISFEESVSISKPNRFYSTTNSNINLLTSTKTDVGKSSSGVSPHSSLENKDSFKAAIDESFSPDKNIPNIGTYNVVYDEGDSDIEEIICEGGDDDSF